MSQFSGFVPENLRQTCALGPKSTAKSFQRAFIFLLRSAALLFGKAASPRLKNLSDHCIPKERSANAPKRQKMAGNRERTVAWPTGDENDPRIDF